MSSVVIPETFVEAGIEVLDRSCVGKYWRSEIDLDHLNMAFPTKADDGCGCMLAQTHGSFGRGMSILLDYTPVPKLHPLLPRSVAYGFDYSPDCRRFTNINSYEHLDFLWRKCLVYDALNKLAEAEAVSLEEVRSASAAELAMILGSSVFRSSGLVWIRKMCEAWLEGRP